MRTVHYLIISELHSRVERYQNVVFLVLCPPSYPYEFLATYAKTTKSKLISSHIWSILPSLLAYNPSCSLLVTLNNSPHPDLTQQNYTMRSATITHTNFVIHSYRRARIGS